MDITFYRIASSAPDLNPARAERGWMNDTPQRFAYRCLPLVIANRSGWEVLCPAPFTATWDGGQDKDSITVEFDDPTTYPFATSHFGAGVLTFHTGYHVKTSEGVSVWAMGSPNEVKDGIQALHGVIETAWLPFSFTMNWKFTRPGRVRFEKGEPFAFLTLTRLADIEAAVPVEGDLQDDPALYAAHRAWADARTAFSAALAAGDPETVKKGWQRDYMRGRHPEGTPAEPPTDHRSKLRVSEILKTRSPEEPNG